MSKVVKIPEMILEETNSGGRDSVFSDSVTDNETGSTVPVGTIEKKNSIRDEAIDYITRIKRHTEKDNEILIEDQVRGGAPESLEAFTLLENIQKSFSSPETKVQGKRNTQVESHLVEKLRSKGSECAADAYRSSPSGEPPKITPKRSSTNENVVVPSFGKDMEEVRKQNLQLMEVLLKTQKNHDEEKKRFHEILIGLDKALSSLPVRLEKIRVRNQRNLSIINSSRFNSGDVSIHFPVGSGSETSISCETVSSQESNYYLSIRMKCLLRKMNQLNELIHTIKQGDSSPIERLVNSELYAISLLKKEIKSTKKQIEESKTDTETVVSCDVSTKGDFTEDSGSKAKNSFSNALNNASNFKIFENHMILQEEALNLLTRKIKETEEALLKEIEANEGLKRENETMAKEIFRLKTTAEETRGEKSLKKEKSRMIGEESCSRPYRLIKELKAKLDEKEKTLIAWKSKYTRLESANLNKSSLIENEKKKNFELENTIRNLKIQNKNLNAHLNSLEFVNQQMKSQTEILKSQVEILAKERLEHQLEIAENTSKIGEQVAVLNERLKMEEAKAKETEKKAAETIKEMEKLFEAQLAEVKVKLTTSQNKNEEFCNTFKELLIVIHKSSLKKDGRSMSRSSYNKIRKILQITPSDLEALFNVDGNFSRKEAEELYAEFKSIVEGEEKKFSSILSCWLFDVITEKLLQQCPSDRTIYDDET